MGNGLSIVNLRLKWFIRMRGHTQRNLNRDIDATNELFMCSDASESHLFIFDMKRYCVHKEKHFELVSDFEFNDCEKNLTSSFQELLSVILKTTFWLYQLRTA